AFSNDPIWRWTTLIRQTSDHFRHRRGATSAQTVQFRSSCGTTLFDAHLIRARHGRTAQPLFVRSDRFAAVSFRRNGQYRVAKITRCNCIVSEDGSRKPIRVPLAMEVDKREVWPS